MVTMKSAIILAGGQSRRLGREKGLLLFGKQTLVEHVSNRLRHVAGEVIIATATKKQRKIYSKLLTGCVITTDEESGGPLAGVWSALQIVSGKAVAIVGCDMPLISEKAMRLLFELCKEHDAAIPQWPNGYIEPLHAVYNTSSCIKATRKALEAGRKDMRAMVSSLANVRFVPTERMQRLGIPLTTFLNINRATDLKKARSLRAHSSK